MAAEIRKARATKGGGMMARRSRHRSLRSRAGLEEVTRVAWFLLFRAALRGEGVVARSWRRTFRIVITATARVIRRVKVAFISGTSIVNSTLFSSWDVKTVETKYGAVT